MYVSETTLGPLRITPVAEATNARTSVAFIARTTWSIQAEKRKAKRKRRLFADGVSQAPTPPSEEKISKKPHTVRDQIWTLLPNETIVGSAPFLDIPAADVCR